MAGGDKLILKERESMWKKHGSALLGIILTIAVLLTGVKLPDFVSAAGNDKTSLVESTAKMTISQKQGYDGYKPVTGDINTENDIQIDMSFTGVFNKTLDADKHIEKGDYVEFNLGDKLKFAGDNEALDNIKESIIDKASNLKICDVIFTKSADGNVKVRFDFSDTADEVFEKESTTVGASIKVKADLSKFDFVSTTEKVIRIFGKEYKVGVIDSDAKITKTGVLDVKNSRIDWTITVERFVKGVEPKQPLSLEGYTIEEIPDSLNELGNNYIPGTFTINDKSRDNESGLNIGTNYKGSLYYTIKAEDLDANNNSKAVIKLSTDVNFGGEFNNWGERRYGNKARLVKYGTSKYWDAYAGVDVKKMGQKTGAYDAKTKTITWTIDFNYPPYELGDVTISDELTKDNQGRIPQKFKKAYIQYYDNTSSKFSDTKTEIAPVVSGYNHTFTIPNVTGRFKLIIETEIEPDNYRIDFSNDAYVWWNGNVKNKAKLHADIYTEPGGNIKFGEINKTAKSQATTAEDKTYGRGEGEYIGFEPEWTVTADEASVSTPGDYYMYDTFIFDNKVNVDSKTINETNGYSIRKVGDTSVTTLANGISFDRVITNNVIPRDSIYKRHQKLVKPNNPVIDATEGVTNSVYEVVKDGVVVGHILELKLVPGVNNFAKFKSRVTEKKLIVLDQDDGVYQLQNYIALAKGDYIALNKTVAYHYQPKLLAKQVVSKTAAKKFLVDYNAEATNSDVYNSASKRIIDNRDTAYDRDTRSVLFRISVNAKDIKDVDGDIGKLILKDILSYKLKLAPIKKDSTGDKYFLIYKGKPALKYKDTNEADQRYGKVPTDVYDNTGEIGAIVDAFGNPLTDEEIAASGITTNIGKDDYRNDMITFSFDKINSPYVIFVKGEMKSDIPLNDKNEVWNEAIINIEGSYPSIKKTAYANYDERFLWKNYDGQDSKDKINVDDNGFIKWNVYYKPYRVYAANDIATVRLEDEVNRYLVLRKEKGTEKLIFADDNYKVWKGEYDGAGNFVNPVEITTGLDEIFKYDLAKKKLVMHIPDRNAGYRFSYITDFAKDVEKNAFLDNSVALIESNKAVGREVMVRHTVEADVWGSLKDMNYNVLQIIKKNTDGEALAGAKFSLKRLADGTVTGNDIGTVETVTNGAVKFNKLVAGSYELTETKAPDGYETNGVVYKIKVVELENGELSIVLDGNYEGKASFEQKVLTVINKKKPVTPPAPVTPPTPVNPTPVIPPTPENPTPVVPVTPQTPSTPNPTPDIPSYPIDNTPNPNDPNSPDEFEVIGNDGTPQGKVVKTTKPNGEKEYVFDKDKTPLDGFKVKKGRKALPKTGGASTVWYYAAGAGLVIMAGFALRKRKEEE